MASTDIGAALEARLSRIEALLATLYAIEGGVAQPEMLRLLTEFASDPQPQRSRLALEQLAAFASEQRRMQASPDAIGQVHYSVRSLDDRVQELRSRVEHLGQVSESAQLERGELREHVGSLQDFVHSRFTSLERTTRDIRFDADRLMVAFTLGLPLDDVPLHRTFPVRVYLSSTNGRRTARISDAVKQLLESAGFKVAHDLPPITGSWYKEWFARSESLMTRPEVQERLAKIERAAELELIITRRAEADRNHAEGISSLIRALDGQEHACIQAGNILLVKTTREGVTSIVSRTLTEKEAAIIERRPSLLRDPAHILEILGVPQDAGSITPQVVSGEIPAA